MTLNYHVPAVSGDATNAWSTAFSSVQAAGGGTITSELQDYTISAALPPINNDNITIDVQKGTRLVLATTSPGLNLMSTAPKGSWPTALAVDMLRGDQQITVTDASQCQPGRLIWIAFKFTQHNPLSDGSTHYWSHVSPILSVSGNVVKLRERAEFHIYADAVIVQVIDPIKNFVMRNLGLVGYGTVGADGNSPVHGLYQTGTLRARIEHCDFEGFSSGSGHAIGKGTELVNGVQTTPAFGGYDDYFHDNLIYKCGGPLVGDQSYFDDFSLAHSWRSKKHMIVSRDGTGFGQRLESCGWTQDVGSSSVNQTNRGMKWSGAYRCMMIGAQITNGGQGGGTGLGISGACQSNWIQADVSWSGGVGQSPGNRFGLWFSDQKNGWNTVFINSQDNPDDDIYVGASDVYNSIYGRAGTITNLGGAILRVDPC